MTLWLRKQSESMAQHLRFFKSDYQLTYYKYQSNIISIIILILFGKLGLVHWDDPERWNGKGVGRRVQDGEHMYTCGGLCKV